ncbi:thioredoxin domain-containing protein [Streptomyces sp. NPDC012637]|uniref:thioredoxin domain-containing protein n=1 Tax=Streptomyces sp. NPDC012637 TaxID=3364842 RepID=UPI0036E5165B
MRVRGTRRAALAAAVAGLTALAAVGCSQGGGASDAALTVAAADHADVLAGLPAAVDGAEIVVGEAEAPHTVTVFVDPRCSYCARFEAGSGASPSGRRPGRCATPVSRARPADQAGRRSLTRRCFDRHALLSVG